MERELNWNFEEFSTFLLIYASHADLEFSDDEKSHIQKQVSQATFGKVYKTYDQLGDYEKLQLIMDYKGLYYPTVDRKEELLGMVLKLFFSDGQYSSLEKGLMDFLRRLL